MRRLLLCALLALACVGTGCIHVGVVAGREIPQADVEGIVPGVTTRAEILQVFGAPTHYTDGAIFAALAAEGEIAAEDIVALPYADLLVYEILEGEGRALLLLLFNYLQIDAERDRLVVFFDEDDVVLYYGFSRQRGVSGAMEEHNETRTNQMDCVGADRFVRGGRQRLLHRTRLCRQGAAS